MSKALINLIGYALLKEFVERNARRVRDRWRATRLVNWLSEQEAILWMSIIKPTASAQQGELPNLHSFRGLRALTEVKNEKGEIEWHFLWGTEGAAEQHESGVASRFGSTSAMRAAVRSVTIPKEKWWKWFPLGKLAIALGSLAVISSNLETVKNFGLQLIHQPEITLQSRNTIQLKSDSKQDEDVVLLGDPFFSARLVDPTMSIKPDPAYPGGAALPNRGKVPIPKYNRTFDVSQELKLTLPFENLPAGSYLAQLGGVVHTAWRSAPFAPSHSIPLDVRGPVAARKTKVYPWLVNVSGQAYRGPPNVRGEKIFPYALVDLELLFGRPETKILNVRVVLTGNWIGWSLKDPLPGVIIERESQNTPHSPKAVVFVLKGLLGAEFTSTPVRLHLWAKEPLTAEQWDRKVPEPIAELED